MCGFACNNDLLTNITSVTKFTKPYEMMPQFFLYERDYRDKNIIKNNQTIKCRMYTRTIIFTGDVFVCWWDTACQGSVFSAGYISRLEIFYDHT